LLFLVTCINSLSPDGKCRILALRGGGVHGAYEVGALQAFVQELDPLDIHYDHLSGVSVGALNAAFIAMHPPGDEK
jgi:predicted acylesterase/phospholipase RssA